MRKRNFFGKYDGLAIMSRTGRSIAVWIRVEKVSVIDECREPPMVWNPSSGLFLHQCWIVLAGNAVEKIVTCETC